MPPLSSETAPPMHARLTTTTVRLVRGDLTDEAVDAIVNAANASLLGGGGVDGAIHARGGPAILEACRAIRRTDYPGGLPVGEAVLTTGGDLPARHVIHTVGPVWQGGDEGEPEALARAYTSSLSLARDHGLRTVAFPAVSAGVYGYPVDRAGAVALDAAAAFVEAHPEAFDELRFVLFSDRAFDAFAAAFTERFDESPGDG